jgi:hypothetical protein
MTDKPPYEITRARLKALSPAARAIADDALKYGLWRLIEESKSETATGR